MPLTVGLQLAHNRAICAPWRQNRGSRLGSNPRPLIGVISVAEADESARSWRADPSFVFLCGEVAVEMQRVDHITGVLDGHPGLIQAGLFP